MSVEFKGEKFEPRGPANRIRVLYLSKVARDNQKRIAAAEKSGDDDMAAEAMMHVNAALMDLIESVVRPEDWERFLSATDVEGVRDDELYAFASQMMTAGAKVEHPTERSSDSSAGPSTTPESSVSRLEQLATERYPGRPDLVIAATAQERTSMEETAQLLDMWATA